MDTKTDKSKEDPVKVKKGINTYMITYQSL